MYAAEKRDIIEAINEIRESIGLQPYDAEQLSEMDVEELKNLYRAQKKLKEVSESPDEEREERVEGYVKPAEKFEEPSERPQMPRINWKHVLLVIVPVACVAAALILYFTIFKNFSSGGEGEKTEAEITAIISGCNAMIDEVLTINNTCSADGDCTFTSFCNCANEVTYQDVERIIEKSDCKEFKLTDCPALICSCVNGKCAS